MLSITSPSSADASMISQVRDGGVEHSAERIRRMGAMPARDVGKLKEAAQEFEAVFISQMLEHMFAVSKRTIFLGGVKLKTFTAP
jgi:Rod binding domain-containing protein